MKPEIQQEILLVTSTTFCQGQFCEIDGSQHNRNLSDSEKLEEACWNGLLDDLLPEIMERTAFGKRLYLWQIRKGEFFLQIELAESPMIPEKQFSINPDLFLEIVSNN